MNRIDLDAIERDLKFGHNYRASLQIPALISELRERRAKDAAVKELVEAVTVIIHNEYPGGIADVLYDEDLGINKEWTHSYRTLAAVETLCPDPPMNVDGGKP